MNKKTALIKGLSVLSIILLITTLTGCASANRDLPLNGFSDGGANPINYLLVYPMAYIMKFFGSLFNDSLAMGTIFLTIIVRFAAFPIYAGASMGNEVKTLKAKPDLEALAKKYEGRVEPEMQQQKMMEQFAINKKHGINPLKSCMIMPIQMAIFYAMFEVLYRVRVDGGKLSLSNSSFLGFDLALSLSDSSIGNKIFLCTLAAITGLTTYLHMKMVTSSQQKQQATPQTDAMSAQMNSMFKYMPLIQAVMIASFAINSGAMGLYYVIGNTCSILQTIVLKKINAKKMAAYLEEQKNGVIEIL